MTIEPRYLPLAWVSDAGVVTRALQMGTITFEELFNQSPVSATRAIVAAGDEFICVDLMQVLLSSTSTKMGMANYTTHKTEEAAIMAAALTSKGTTTMSLDWVGRRMGKEIRLSGLKLRKEK